MSELEKCRECCRNIDDNGECDCQPKDYVRPGSECIMYVNAYEVTREFGGPEEGGWYFNQRSPIASIPIKAISTEGHDDDCWNCRMAREGKTDPHTNEPYKFCRWGFNLDVASPEQQDMFTEHLKELYADVNEGSIYSVLGGSELLVCTQDHPAEFEPSERPHYE